MPDLMRTYQNGDVWTDAKIRRENKRREQRAETDRLVMLGPERAAEELGRYCPFCGKLQVPRVEHYELPWLQYPRKTFVWKDHCGCEGEVQAIAEMEELKEKRTLDEQRRDWKRRLDEAGLSDWMGTTFDTFLPRDDWPCAEKKKESVVQYAELMIEEKLADKPFLLLYGHFGTGKSHLAAATVRYALDAGWRDVHFCQWTRWTEKVKESWNGTGSTRNLHAKLRDGRLVVIDDLDKKTPTNWTREVLFPIVDRRVNACAPTILTFNRSPGEVDKVAPKRLAVEEYLGRAVLDRVMGAAFLAINFDGPSMRSGAYVPADQTR